MCAPPEIPHADKAGLYMALGIVNIILPGIGAMVLGCMISDCATVCIGICQMLLIPIGWVWAIIYGVVMISMASDYKTKEAPPPQVVYCAPPTQTEVA